MVDKELLIAIEQLFDTKFDEKFDEKLEPIKLNIIEMQKDIIEMKTDITEMKTDITEMKTDIVEVKIRLDKVESDTSSLRAGQLIMRKDLNEIKEIALDAWGQSTENRMLLKKYQ